eukprot:CAMPEP_0118811296 /NCGR_PEP_ID=MMETSP1162-20130426/1562_1 /TAXON_ID=33656 /ORGANISM="Phaeocystis Sp, Strain CCMP2710" /LENGTH=181 /DNA_ID=CAMNT_0006740923 /DNA_START=229 /DNA_END=772 /DNA_ORIENTATION=+
MQLVAGATPSLGSLATRGDDAPLGRQDGIREQLFEQTCCRRLLHLGAAAEQLSPHEDVRQSAALREREQGGLDLLAIAALVDLAGDVRLRDRVEEALALQALLAARLGEDHRRLASDCALDLREDVERDRHLRDLGHGSGALRSWTSGCAAQLERVGCAEHEEEERARIITIDELRAEAQT